MDCANLMKAFHCKLYVDKDDSPKEGIILVGVPADPDESVQNLLLEKAEKIKTVLLIVMRMNNNQISLQIYRACLSVVLLKTFSAPHHRRRRAGCR